MSIKRTKNWNRLKAQTPKCPLNGQTDKNWNRLKAQTPKCPLNGQKNRNGYFQNVPQRPKLCGRTWNRYLNGQILFYRNVKGINCSEISKVRTKFHTNGHAPGDPMPGVRYLTQKCPSYHKSKIKDQKTKEQGDLLFLK
jgi:hypothetical protein